MPNKIVITFITQQSSASLPALHSPTKLSTIIEVFYPHSFAHDYHWTARALNIPNLTVEWYLRRTVLELRW